MFQAIMNILRIMKFRRVLLGTALALNLAIPVAMVAGSTPVYAANNAKSALCTAIESNSGCTKVTQGSSINHVITAVVNVLSVIVGITAVIMIIIGGLRYITSGGDANNTASAKNTILFAIVGLVIVLLSQTIVHFVLNKF